MSPGLSVTSLFPSAVTKFLNGTSVTSGQSFMFGFGGNYTGTANRIVALTWYDVFADFHSPLGGYLQDCSSGSRIEGNLKLGEVIFALIYAAKVPNNMSNPFVTGGPYSNAQDTISFEIDTSGNATPSWKYVDVASNPSGTLLNLDRDRKDQLLITMGPSELDKKTRKLVGVGAVIGGNNSVSTIHNIARITLPIQP